MKENKFIEYIKGIVPGFLVALAVALVGMFIAKFVPKLGAGTISIFLGMFVGNLFLNQDVFQKGYKFSETDILSYSISICNILFVISTIFYELLFFSLLLYIRLLRALSVSALFLRSLHRSPSHPLPHLSWNWLLCTDAR